jgi:Trk K+ transport system NAD-binding subunit
VRRAMEEARRMNGSLKVLVRAVDGPHAMQLSEMGADAVVQPEREGGVALARRALTS